MNKFNFKISFVSIFLLFSLITHANESTETKYQTFFCDQSFEKLPIQQNGRVKPLLVHANETIKNLYGKTTVNSLSSVMAYCLLSIQGLGLNSGFKLMTKIEHVEVQKILGLNPKNSEISYDDLINSEKTLRFEMMKTKEENSYKKSLMQLMTKISIYKDTIEGSNWKLAEIDNEKKVIWIPLTNYLTEAKVKSYGTDGGPFAPFQKAIHQSSTNYESQNGTKYLVEVTFAKLGLPHFALLFSLLALAAGLLFSKRPIVTLVMAGLTLSIQLVYIIFRIYISERAPITNMYETVLFSGFGGLVLAMIVGHFTKEKILVYVGLGYNVCTLFMINFANGMLNPNIGPLVPVLRDNFWLSTHVTTVILSYGALALSWILSTSTLIRRKYFKLTDAEFKNMSDLLHTTLKFGTIMLAAGIILGGVWADYSWGRFWGWDPKETWSLIVLIIYMAILHGRHTNWINNDRFVSFVSGAFMSVMMAWFGVNYILASGLHSYGFSEGGAIFLGSFFLFQIIIVTITYPKKA